MNAHICSKFHNIGPWGQYYETILLTDLSDFPKDFSRKICWISWEIFSKGKITRQLLPIFGNFLRFFLRGEIWQICRDNSFIVLCPGQLANIFGIFSGWVEWMYHKVNIKNLKKHIIATANVSTGSVCSASPPLPESVVDYLVW